MDTIKLIAKIENATEVKIAALALQLVSNKSTISCYVLTLGVTLIRPIQLEYIYPTLHLSSIHLIDWWYPLLHL